MNEPQLYLLQSLQEVVQDHEDEGLTREEIAEVLSELHGTYVVE